MRTANPYFDIALWGDNSGASLGQTYIGTLDFDWGPTDWVNVSDWHRYTVSFDQVNNVVLLFVDGVMLQNYSNTDPDMSVDFSPEASSTFFLGMYGEWSWGDDDSGQLFFLNDDRFRGQIDEVASGTARCRRTTSRRSRPATRRRARASTPRSRSTRRCSTTFPCPRTPTGPGRTRASRASATP